MMRESGAPGVQHGGDADAGSQMLGIHADGAELAKDAISGK